MIDEAMIDSVAGTTQTSGLCHTRHFLFFLVGGPWRSVCHSALLVTYIPVKGGCPGHGRCPWTGAVAMKGEMKGMSFKGLAPRMKVRSCISYSQNSDARHCREESKHLEPRQMKGRVVTQGGLVWPWLVLTSRSSGHELGTPGG